MSKSPHVSGLLLGVLVSMILHGMIIVGLWSRKSNQDTTSQRPLEDQTVALEIRGAPSMSGAEHTNDFKSQQKAQSLKMKDLRPKRQFIPINPSDVQEGGAKSVAGDQVDGGAAGSWGMGMGLEASLAANPFLSEVAGRVFEHLSYPEDFVRSRIWGQVKARIELDRRGVFSGKFLDLEGGSDLLRAYVGATLVSALKHPLREKSWMTNDALCSIDLSFNFEIYSDESARPRDESFYFKNVIHTHMAAYAPPLVNQKIEEWMTHYVPLIIPLPGGVYIDFVRAYQLIKNLGEPSESEARERRLNILKDQLNSTLREKNS